MIAFWMTLGLATLAELGDRTQLLTLAFATRYSMRTVALGVVVGGVTVQVLPVVVGHSLGVVLPMPLVQTVAGLIFLAFAVLMFRARNGKDKRAEAPSRLPPVAMVAGTFFLAELGDKTQLTTLALASQWPQEAVYVWLGSVLGLLAANVLAIGTGRFLGDRLAPGLIRTGAAVIFAGIGLVALAIGLSQLLT